MYSYATMVAISATMPTSKTGPERQPANFSPRNESEFDSIRFAADGALKKADTHFRFGDASASASWGKRGKQFLCSLSCAPAGNRCARRNRGTSMEVTGKLRDRMHSGKRRNPGSALKCLQRRMVLQNQNASKTRPKPKPKSPAPKASLHVRRAGRSPPETLKK